MTIEQNYNGSVTKIFFKNPKNKSKANKSKLINYNTKNQDYIYYNIY